MLFNIKARKRTTEEEFRRAFPAVSFPTVLTNDLLVHFDHTLLYIPTKPEAEIGYKVIDGGERFVGGLWRLRWELVKKTPQELQDDFNALEKAYSEVIQKLLDDKARERKYDNINSLCTYATSKREHYRREAQAAVDWRDDVWDYSKELLGKVLAGLAPIPTLQQVLDGMPKFVWPDQEPHP